MGNLTWKQLKAHIETMDDSQINSNVTVHITGADEFVTVPAIDYVSIDGNDVLDPFHPFLIVDI